MMQRKLILLTIALASATAGIMAQRPVERPAERARWYAEMRDYKHSFLTRELKLSHEQQAAFFEVYDAMDDEISKLNSDTRDLERKVSGAGEASDVEIESAARAVYGQKSAEGDIELRYFDKFKEILTPQQLLNLRNAERKFTQQLVKQHRRFKNADQRRKQ